MRWVTQWLRQSDHYDRLSAHLAARSLDTVTRFTISFIAGGLSIVALGTIFSPAGPANAVQLACALASSAGAAAGSALWAACWPTRKMAIGFALLSSLCIALIALAQSDPVVALLTCTTFATIATHIALFHRAWLMTTNFGVASVIGAIEGVRIARTIDVVVAVCGYALLLLLNLAVPFGVQVVVHVLGADAVRAERDQLTGLYTRRAFHRRAIACLELGSQRRAHFVISVIDLDRFKQLNDRYGHSAGDDALVSVACALRDTCDDTALICRSGGEEFVIADIWHPSEVSRRAQQICEVIAALPFGITASLGTAGFRPGYRTDSRREELVELIAAADAAMYAAKRRGGNQADHHEWPLQHPLSPVGEDDIEFRADGLSA